MGELVASCHAGLLRLTGNRQIKVDAGRLGKGWGHDEIGLVLIGRGARVLELCAESFEFGARGGVKVGQAAGAVSLVEGRVTIAEVRYTALFAEWATWKKGI